MLTLDALLLEGAQLPNGWSRSSSSSAGGGAPVAAVDVVKIDVAGTECHVLDGGSRALFHKLRPRLIVINVQESASEACVASLAKQHGFEVLPLALPPPALANAKTSSSRGAGPLQAAGYARGKHVVMVDRKGTATRASGGTGATPP